MAFTFIGSAVGTSAAKAPSLTTSTSLNVQAGDVLVAICANASYESTVTGIQDSNSNNPFTLLSEQTIDGQFLQLAYVLSATAGTVTFTRTCSSVLAYTNQSLIILQFRGTGTAVIDQAGPFVGTQGWGTSATSATMTTTGTDEIIIGAVSFDSSAGAATSMTISGIAGSLVQGYTGSAAAYAFFSSIQTGEVEVANFSASAWGLVNALSIKETGGGSNYPVSGSDASVTSDTAAGAATLPVSGSDTSTTSDLASGSATLPVMASDTVTTSDSASGHPIYASSVADALGITDAANASGIYLVAVSDSLATADSATPGSTYQVSVGDSLSTSDLANATGIWLAIASDSLATSDLAAGGIAIYSVSVADAVATGDQAGASSIVQAVVADFLGVTDSAFVPSPVTLEAPVVLIDVMAVVQAALSDQMTLVPASLMDAIQAVPVALSDTMPAIPVALSDLIAQIPVALVDQ